MKTSDVVISGGGIPGLVLGILLAQAGVKVCVIDPAKLPLPADIKPTGRTSALMEDSLSILKNAGVWNDIAPHSADLRRLAIVDSSQHVEFSADEVGKTRFGSNIVNGLLLATAAERFKSLPGATLLQTTVQAFNVTSSGVSVTLADGMRLDTPLLVGADGRNSLVRQLSGIESYEHDYPQMALTALLAHTKPHQHISTEFHRPGGPFTLVPMPGNASSLVWLDTTGNIERMLRLSKKDLEQTLQDLSQGLLGTITLTTNPEAWPLKVMKAKAYTADRVALIAEAAHVLSPIGAQGLNLSLRDAHALSQEIINAMSCGLDQGSPAVLKKYAANRALDISLRVAGTHVFNQIVATDSPFLASLRQLGLRVVSSISPLRRLAMQEGMIPAQETKSGLTTRANVSTSTR
jgi:2-octaprenyl-6-methoxyphenol hydroxylase